MLLIKEHVGMFKAANNFDIHDPEADEVVLYCREDSLGPFTKILRLTDFKRYTPFDIRAPTTTCSRSPTACRRTVACGS